MSHRSAATSSGTSNVGVVPLSQCLGDRRRLLGVAFGVLGKKRIRSMMPEEIKNLSRVELRALCLEELESIPKDLLRAVLEGKYRVQQPASSESVKSEKKSLSKSSPKDGKTQAVADSTSDSVSKHKKKKKKHKKKSEMDCDSSHTSARRRSPSQSVEIGMSKREMGHILQDDASSKSKKKTKEKAKDPPAPAAASQEGDDGKSLMELMELEMRKRAIKSLLVQQQKQQQQLEEMEKKLEDVKQTEAKEEVAVEEMESVEKKKTTEKQERVEKKTTEREERTERKKTTERQERAEKKKTTERQERVDKKTTEKQERVAKKEITDRQERVEVEKKETAEREELDAEKDPELAEVMEMEEEPPEVSQPLAKDMFDEVSSDEECMEMCDDPVVPEGTTDTLALEAGIRRRLLARHYRKRSPSVTEQPEVPSSDLQAVSDVEEGEISDGSNSGHSVDSDVHRRLYAPYRRWRRPGEIQVRSCPVYQRTSQGDQIVEEDEEVRLTERDYERERLIRSRHRSKRKRESPPKTSGPSSQRMRTSKPITFRLTKGKRKSDPVRTSRTRSPEKVSEKQVDHGHHSRDFHSPKDPEGHKDTEDANRGEPRESEDPEDPKDPDANSVADDSDPVPEADRSSPEPSYDLVEPTVSLEFCHSSDSEDEPPSVDNETQTSCESGNTWSERWFSSGKVQKVVTQSKMFGKVRNKLKSLNKKKEPEAAEDDGAANVEETKAPEVIGSIEEYERLFGKKVVTPPPRPPPEETEPQTEEPQPEETQLTVQEDVITAEDSDEDLWSSIMGR